MCSLKFTLCKQFACQLEQTEYRKKTETKVSLYLTVNLTQLLVIRKVTFHNGMPQFKGHIERYAK